MAVATANLTGRRIRSKLFNIINKCGCGSSSPYLYLRKLQAGRVDADVAPTDLRLPDCAD
jgi:hypothetical protein